MAKGGKRAPRPARTELDALREYANSLAPQKGFFSTLDELVQQAPFERAPVNQWRGYLQPGRMLKRDEAQFPLKQEEIDYALNNVLGPREADDVNFPSPIDKAELLDLIRRNRPRFELTQGYQFKGGSGEPTTAQIAQLVGPGVSEKGGFTWSGSSGQVHTPKDTRLQIRSTQYGPDSQWGGRLSHVSPGSRYEESATRMRGVDFRSHSFPQDTVSWGRTSTHQLPSGERVRLIEEIQSDLHAAARRPVPHAEWVAFMTPEEAARRNDLLYDIREKQEQIEHLNTRLADRAPQGEEHLAQEWLAEMRKLQAELEPLHNEASEIMDRASARVPLRGYRNPEDQAAYDRIPSHLNRDWTPEEEAVVRRVESAVPDAPFKETQEYAALEMRKQLLNAVNNEEDYLALTTADDQIARYYDEDDVREDPSIVAGMRNAYDTLYRSALEKLGRRYGADMTEVEARVGARKDTRPAVMRQLDAENLNDFLSFVDDSDSWRDRMNWLKELPYQLGMTGKEALEVVQIGRRLADLQEELLLDYDKDFQNRSPERERWRDAKDAARAATEAEYRRRLEPLFEQLAAEGQAQAKKFPALRLTPEVRERIKRLGVPLWSVVGGAVVFDDETEGQEFAEGGEVEKNWDLEDLKTAFEIMNPNLSRGLTQAAHGFRTQWMGQDETGVLRPPIWNDWDAPKEEWVWNDEAQMALPPQRQTRPGIVDETIGLPAFFGFGPQASFDASDRVQALDEALRAEHDVPDPETWADHIGGAAGVMAGQIPVPSGLVKGGIGALGKYVPKIVKSVANAPGIRQTLNVASAIPEWFMPTIDPKLQNYAMGTAAGAAMTKYLPELVAGLEDEPAEEDIDWSDPNLTSLIERAVAAGELSEDEAELLLSEIAARSGTLESPENEETGMAKGGRVRLTTEQLTEAAKRVEAGQSIAEVADNLGVNYPALYKRLTRAGVVEVKPIVRNELTLEARLEALQRALAGENQYHIAEDLGVSQSAINQIKKRHGEIEGHAKGGKIKPGDTLKLREQIRQLLSEASVPEHQQIVPVDPIPNETNLPAPDEFQLPDTGLPAPETNLPEPQGTVSRRDVLHGMASLASPIDPTALLDVKLNDLTEAVAPAVKAVKSFTPAQVARHLASIWETSFGMSDDSIEDLLVAAEEAKQLPGSEGLVSILEQTYKNLEALGNQGADHDEYSKLYGQVHSAIQEEMAKIADAQGVIAWTDQWEDLGGPESGPGPLVPLDPVFAEPIPGGGKSLTDWIERIRDVESSRRLGIPDPDARTLAIADEVEAMLKEYGPRADAIITSSVMNAGHGPLNRAFEEMAARLEKRGFDVTARDIWTILNSTLDSNYSEHGGLREWMYADPEDRARIHDLYNRPVRDESWPEAQPLEDEYSEILDRIYGPGSPNGPRE